MRNILKFAIVFTMFFSFFRSEAQSLSQGLVGDYSFNGNANDNSGFGNHGIVWGATLATGKSGQPFTAYHFDGSTNYIEVPNSPTLNLDTAMTLYAVFKPEGFYNGPCQANTLLNKWSSINGGTGYGLIFSDNVYDLDCNNIDTNHSVPQGVTAGNNWWQGLYNFGLFIHTNQWYCLTFTQLGDTQKIYVDGLLYVSAFVNNIHAGANTDPLFFGKNNLGIPSYTGIIDDIKIYNRALSAIEVAALCSSTNTAVAEISASNFILSPNPSKNGLFQIKSDSRFGKYDCEIINSLGQLLQNHQFSGVGNSTIDLSNEPNGIYILKIKTGNDTFIKKLLKY